MPNYRWPQTDELNRALEAVITDLENTDAGISRSNVGGWHSNTDFLCLPIDCIEQLRERVRLHVSQLFAAVAADPLDQRFGRLSIEGWANILCDGKYNSLHSHPNAFWSGVYYVNGNPRPESERPFSGKLELVDPRPGASLSYAEAPISTADVW